MLQVLMVSLAIISYFLVVENKLIGGWIGVFIQPYFLFIAIDKHCLSLALLAIFFFLINMKFIIDKNKKPASILDSQKVITRA